MKLPKTSITVTAVRCDHSVDCLGFMFEEYKQKLKPELQGKTGREIGELRKKGVEVTVEVRRPLFAFLGDTTHHVFEETPSLLDCPVVIVECSFIHAEHQDLAEKKKHAVWEGGLDSIVQEHPSTHFVLIHFSLRYSLAEIHAYFEKLNLPNVTPWLSNSRVVDQMRLDEADDEH